MRWLQGRQWGGFNDGDRNSRTHAHTHASSAGGQRYLTSLYAHPHTLCIKLPVCMTVANFFLSFFIFDSFLFFLEMR